MYIDFFEEQRMYALKAVVPEQWLGTTALNKQKETVFWLFKPVMTLKECYAIQFKKFKPHNQYISSVF